MNVGTRDPARLSHAPTTTGQPVAAPHLGAAPAILAVDPTVAPHHLLAPPPQWVRRVDVVVVGSGVAGLATALAIHRAAPQLSVLIVSKTRLDGGATRWAQGGIAAAVGPDDSPAEHLRDTIAAGGGLCDEAAVRVLVHEGPCAVRRLVGIGAVFDRNPDGTLALTREGGHRRRRIVHAGGDATGAEMSRALLAALAATGGARSAGCDVIEHALVLDLMRDQHGRAAGITLHVAETGRSAVGAVHARAVVLATGGLGQIYAATTNPEVSTGDGIALALRAGAVVCDLEFVQFHPTVLWLGPGRRGRLPLISEAVRGEGAFLVDGAGDRFMVDVHPLGDLAPRDVVARTSTAVMIETGADHVYLDGRGLGASTWRQRFPTVLRACRDHGIDPVRELIPVSPAAHYASGGVRTDLHGRTSVPGLYACGEVACTGVHGANRLASNSLLEGLVFAERVAEDIAATLPPAAEPVTPTGPATSVDPSVTPVLRRVMSRGAGVLRSGETLTAAGHELAELWARRSTRPQVAAWEATNMQLVATALVTAAAARQETRGCHWRDDHPGPVDAWRGHVTTVLDDDGLVARFEPCTGAIDPDKLADRRAGDRSPTETRCRGR